jgi:hypothetical protein
MKKRDMATTIGLGFGALDGSRGQDLLNAHQSNLRLHRVLSSFAPRL